MSENIFDTDYQPTWCPGCGNFGTLTALKQVFNQLNWQPGDFTMVYDIGCSGNMNDFIKAYGFHGLHGRAIPAAVGIHLADPSRPVIVIAGDGGTYGEGGNHLLHAIRGNFDITVLVADNRVYGLTTGQVAPTAPQGFKSKSTPQGLIETPLQPLTLALSQGISFLAQGFAGDISQLAKLLIAGIKHKGFSLINILQPCVTFNPAQSYDWYRSQIYEVTKPFIDTKTALTKIMSNSHLPTGLIYQTSRPDYSSQLPNLKVKIDFPQLLSEFL